MVRLQSAIDRLQEWSDAKSRSLQWRAVLIG